MKRYKSSNRKECKNETCKIAIDKNNNNREEIIWLYQRLCSFHSNSIFNRQTWKQL